MLMVNDTMININDAMMSLVGEGKISFNNGTVYKRTTK